MVFSNLVQLSKIGPLCRNHVICSQRCCIAKVSEFHFQFQFHSSTTATLEFEVFSSCKIKNRLFANIVIMKLVVLYTKMGEEEFLFWVDDDDSRVKNLGKQKGIINSYTPPATLRKACVWRFVSKKLHLDAIYVSDIVLRYSRKSLAICLLLLLLQSPMICKLQALAKVYSRSTSFSCILASFNRCVYA